MAQSRSSARTAATRKPRSIAGYLAGVRGERRRRLDAILATFRAALGGVDETMRYRMPTFERDGHWVAVASQKQYLSVYFCSEDLIAELRAHHPELDCGKGCVRIRDSQHVPLYELERAYLRAMCKAPGAAKAA